MISIVMTTITIMAVTLEVKVTSPVPSIILTMYSKTITIVTILLKGFQTSVRMIVMAIGINFGDPDVYFRACTQLPVILLSL